MGIFDDPKSLAKLLASVKVSGKKRPLTPIQTARCLQQGVSELGSVEEVMKRVDLKKSMWDGFQKLLKVDEDIENSIIWGESDPETMEIGFSVAHSLASLDSTEQKIIVNTMWEYNRPFSFELIQKIKSDKKNNPSKPFTDIISSILKIELPAKVIEIFISGIKTSIYENLKNASQKENIPIEKYAARILSKHFSQNSIIGAKISKNLIRIAFTENGKKEFNKMILEKKYDKNNFLNHIFEEDGF